MSSHDHHHHHHGHHGHNHDQNVTQDHIDADLGPMYKLDWVQKLLKQIQDFVQTNSSSFGIDDSSSPRILDYACGNGTVSSALLTSFPNATFRGLDIATAQVALYNTEATKLLGTPHDRMSAVQGDLTDPNPTLNEKEWSDFDLAIISMALHHVKDPVDLLKRLRQRVKKGGSVVVIDFLKEAEGKDDVREGDGKEGGKKYNAEDMVDVPNGARVWPGFSMEDVKSDFAASGYEEVDVRVCEEELDVPGNTTGFARMFMARGFAA